MQGMPLHGPLVFVRCAWGHVGLCLTAPHSGGNGMFFLTHCIRIDGRRGELRMP